MRLTLLSGPDRFNRVLACLDTFLAQCPQPSVIRHPSPALFVSAARCASRVDRRARATTLAERYQEGSPLAVRCRLNEL